MVALGVPQTLQGSVDVTTLEGVKQTISIGPMASQEAIKELGTNGGGFMNANSAHPFENPNAWTNMLEIWSLLLVPVASVLAFGRSIGDSRQGRAIFATMAVLLIAGVAVIYWARRQPATCGARRRSRPRQHGGPRGSLRSGDDGVVHRWHKRHLDRRGQRDDRFDDAARWTYPDVQPARRLHLAGRRGFGALRLPGCRHHRGVCRRVDGRAHAGISRQEDRGARNEASHARGADLSAGGARLLRPPRSS